MAEYLSKDEILTYLKPLTNTPAINIKIHIQGMKAADVQPVKRGEWGKRAYDRVQCSYCGKCEDNATDFCPNCGARMDGEING